MNKLQFTISTTLRLVLVLLLIYGSQLTISCQGNRIENKKNHFRVLIDLIAYQQSSIQIFYKLNPDDRYYEELSLKKQANPSTDLQQLVFEFPYGIKPKNIRIDLGENEDDSVRVENIRLGYKNLELNGDHGVYKAWFIFNENVIAGKDGLTYHLKKVNNFFDPQLNGNRLLNSKMSKLFPPDIHEF